jgi:hypothetical protein
VGQSRARAAGHLLQVAGGARTRLAHLPQAMGLSVAPGAAARRLLQAPPSAEALRAEQAAAEAPTVAMAAAPLLAQGGPLVQLSSGLESVRAAVQGRRLRVNEVLNLVLETLHRSLGLRSVVFCLRDAKAECLAGRVAVGTGAADLPPLFRVPLRVTGQPDLFAAVCARGADLLIADSATVAPRLPAWFRERVAAPTFLLLPMMLKGAPVGLIYADRGQANSLVLGETELLLVKGLRDQAVAALSRG